MVIASEPPPTGPAEVGAAPFIGLRPFAREERHLLFGRARDAQILLDKVLSARLTVLYAQSGHGKSSLLRALVIPELEEEDSIVLYFDAWTQEDPLRGLKEELAGLAGRLGVTDAGAGGPTLVDLVRLIATVDGRSVVLVLDQFEEFLVTHGRELDPVRKELAALVRERGLDTHVVLSLREEFLAALQPFRQDILDLFQSTYRLESLSREGLREAIQRPVETFDGTCETGLVEALTRDLKAEEATERADETVGAAVELPMLQLVCSRLWEAARRAGSHDLTLALYERLGRTDRILQEYVRDVMPRRWRDQKLTARLMQLLAPPSGLKMSYSAEDLTETTELPAERVRTELDRLEKARILRTREYRAGTRYELQHDAFVKVVSPWRDAVLHKARRRRVAAGVLGAGLLAALVTAGIWIPLYLQQQAEAERRVEQERQREALLRNQQLIEARESWLKGKMLDELPGTPLADLDGLVASRLDFLTSYYLWVLQGEARLPELKKKLIAHLPLQPERYGVLTPGGGGIPNPEEGWPLTIHVSPQREIDHELFNLEWRQLADYVHGAWGIPVPRRVRLLEDASLGETEVRAQGTGLAPATFELPLHRGTARLAAGRAQMQGPTREFFDRFRQDWTPATGEGLWIVPAWSLPVWKVSDLPVASSSGLTAFAAMQHLIDNPEPLLPQAATRFLLERMEDLFPTTVREAYAVRDDQLATDLAQIVRSNRSLGALPYMLDDLADWPGEESAAVVATWEEGRFLAPVARVPDKLPGPLFFWRWDDLGTQEEAAYGATLRGLPVVDGPIRVIIGTDVERAHFPDGSMSAPVVALMARIRDRFYERYGLTMPGVRFRVDPWDENLPAGAFRIEVFDQTGQNDDAAPVSTPPADLLERLERELSFRVEYWRIRLLTPEDVSSIQSRLPPGLQAWTDANYSLTDLKILMRGVMSPTEAEVEALLERWGGLDDLAQRPSDRTIRYPAWLLGALVFLDGEAERVPGPTLVRQLRALQAARAGGMRDTLPTTQLSLQIRRGTSALADDRIAEARKSFEEAKAKDPAAALAAFLTEWPRMAGAVYLRGLRASEPILDYVTLTDQQIQDLDDLVMAIDPEGDPRTLLGLELYRYAAEVHGSSDPRKSESALRRLVAQSGSADDLPAGHARWLALRFFTIYDPLRDDADWLAHGTTLLESAVRRLDDSEAYNAYRAIADLGRERSTNRWTLDLCRRMADLRPNGIDPSIPLDLALAYVYWQRRAELEHAFQLANHEMQKLDSPQLNAELRSRRREIVRFIQGKALAELAAIGDEERRATARRILESLRDAQTDWVQQEALQELAELEFVEDRFEEMELVLDDAIRLAPKVAQFHFIRLLGRLLQGDEEGAAQTAAGVVAAVTAGDPQVIDSNDLEAKAIRARQADAWHTATIGQLLSASDTWRETLRTFLTFDHWARESTAALAVVLHGADAVPEALEHLRRTWSAVSGNRATWDARIRQHDASAWNEMRTGFLLGEVTREEFLGVLENEDAYATSAIAEFPVTRRAFLCEGYLAEALRLGMSGDKAGMHEALERCVGTGQDTYEAYTLAEILLKRGL